MSVTYTATLPVSEDTVVFVSALLHAERRRLGTRAGTRSLGCYRQAILVLRWLLDGTRIIQLAIDNQVSRSTGYAYLHEGLTVIAEQAPGLSSALLAAKMAGYAHVTIDGTLIETDRSRTPGPTPGVDLWWSGKHDNHGGNVQVITAPDGWPLWTSPVRPGREHDTTALRTHDILPLRIQVWKFCACGDVSGLVRGAAVGGHLDHVDLPGWGWRAHVSATASVVVRYL